MQVNKLYINGLEVPIFDSPIGLESINIALDRDFTYSCIDTKIEAELQFYCGSGKEYLDAEFEAKGIEASGHVTIIDTCGTNAKEYTFVLDFKRYSNKGDFTTVGLVDMNSLWKQELNKEVNVKTDGSGDPADFYVRNLRLKYDYESENVYANVSQDSINSEHAEFYGTIWYNTTPPTTLPPAPVLPPGSRPSGLPKYRSHYIFPRVNQKINELEESEGLNMGYFAIQQYYPVNVPNDQLLFNEVIDTSNVVTTNIISTYSSIEPQPLFTNKLTSGEINLSTENSSLYIDLFDIANVYVELSQINEIISIGEKYENPRYSLKNILYEPATLMSSSSPIGYTFSYNSPPKTINLSGLNIKENESLWIYYECLYTDALFTPYYNSTTNLWAYDYYQIINFKDIRYEFENNINLEFTLTKNTKSSITASGEIEPYHTKTLAYQGAGLLNTIFGTEDNIGNQICFGDLWFSKGDMLRNKNNRADLIVKPTDFFRELEKVVCCGLGYFYDTDPNGIRRLLSVYDFYSDTLVPSQYQFDYNDLIDGKITIEPFLSPFYNEVQIGYSNFKDSPKDFCKQNNYSIDNISESQYTKVSDFIASQYLITKALRLGTEDKELEFDKNIFILSGTQESGYNVTLSQASGYLTDDIEVAPNNYAGINRRYASVLNLFRHLYKWGFSLFADKDKLTVNKYEGNSIYDYDIRDTTSAMPTTSAPNKAESYHGLSACYLPYYNPINSGYVKVDRTIDNIYDKYIKSGLYVPTQITFKTANLSSLDIIDMRAHQYDLFSVTDGVNTYYGNLISANLEDDVTEIKLLRRFKNGI